jgi:urea-proton symporter
MLPTSVGYLVLFVFGVVFTVGIAVVHWLDIKRHGQEMTAERFNTAGRNVKVGLASSSIVAAWTWAATIMMSSSTGYQYGISGPFWYAAGATIQILLFAILAIHLKRKAPQAHTFLEFIAQRYDRKNHILMLVFALMTNIIVTSMIILGGAITLNQLTGMNIYLAAFLIPLSFTIYTMIGGLKASFIADYFHTVILFIVLAVLGTAIYMKFGISEIYEGLRRIPESKQMLTMASIPGLMFGIINIVGNFGTVFVDQAYWQRAIASTNQAASKAYIYGGLAWFSIPFAVATILGVSAAGLGIPVPTPDSVAPIMASHALGKMGSILFLTMLFMAVTSAGSAELTAVTNILVTDVYRHSINPQADGNKLLSVSRWITLGFGVAMGVFSILLFYLGIGLGFVYMAMGIFVSSAVIPIALGLIWKRATNFGAFYGTLLGMIGGVAVWVFTAYATTGHVNVESLGALKPMLFGNLSVFIISGMISVGHSLLSSDHFDFRTLRGKFKSFDEGIA